MAVKKLTENLYHEISHFHARKSVVIVLFVILASYIFSYFLPDNPADFGASSVIPAVFLIIYIFSTRRILEALTLASLSGFIMISKPEAGSGLSWISSTLSNMSTSILSVMMDEDIAWLIIVCGLMGSIIALIEKAGGSFATAAWQAFADPVAVEHIAAHAGMDIGDTLIGMHLKDVAVPVRLSIRQIGEAHLVCARTRRKFVGGVRAVYDERYL